MRTFLLLASLAAIAAPIAPALAQDRAPEDRSLRVRLGLGGQTIPEFIGADKNRWMPYWDISFSRGDDPFNFEAPDESVGFKIVSGGGFAAGPAATLRMSRKEKDVGLPVGKVKTTVEAGGFVQYQFGPSFRIRGEARKGIGGHEGIVGNLGFDYILRDGDRYVLSVGPRVLIANDRFHRAYFGVTPQVALAAGLPVYDPDGGIYGVAGTAGGHVQLSRNFGLFGYARYERLVGDAAKSPIVRELGSRNQFSAGLGLTHTFRLNM